MRRPLRARVLLVAVLAVSALLVTPAFGVVQEAVTVDIRDFSFQPHELVVQSGRLVRWVNRDDFLHSVAVQGGRPGSSTGLIDPGKEHSFAFQQPGRFPYRCGVHPTMFGEIVVQGP